VCGQSVSALTVPDCYVVVVAAVVKSLNFGQEIAQRVQIDKTTDINYTNQ